MTTQRDTNAKRKTARLRNKGTSKQTSSIKEAVRKSGPILSNEIEFQWKRDGEEFNMSRISLPLDYKKTLTKSADDWYKKYPDVNRENLISWAYSMFGTLQDNQGHPNSSEMMRIINNLFTEFLGLSLGTTIGINLTECDGHIIFVLKKGGW